MAKKKVTIESLQKENEKLKTDLENQKKYAKQLREQIEKLKVAPVGRSGVHGRAL